jgi:hypothetical protein
MSLSLANVTFDCDDPIAVAEFWSKALDRAIDPGPSPYFVSIGGGGDPHAAAAGPPNLFFIKVPEAKSVKNRVHLDLASDGRQAEVDRLVALGASHVADHDEHGLTWAVLHDPEGNEFCVA